MRNHAQPCACLRRAAYPPHGVGGQLHPGLSAMRPVCTALNLPVRAATQRREEHLSSVICFSIATGIRAQLSCLLALLMIRKARARSRTPLPPSPPPSPPDGTPIRGPIEPRRATRRSTGGPGRQCARLELPRRLLPARVRGARRVYVTCMAVASLVGTHGASGMARQ